MAGQSVLCATANSTRNISASRMVASGNHWLGQSSGETNSLIIWASDNGTKGLEEKLPTTPPVQRASAKMCTGVGLPLGKKKVLRNLKRFAQRKRRWLTDNQRCKPNSFRLQQRFRWMLRQAVGSLQHRDHDTSVMTVPAMLTAC